MRIQSSMLVHLGFGKYVRSDQVTAVLPIEQDRGPGRRTFVHVQGQTDPVVASRSEDALVRDLVQEPKEITHRTYAVASSVMVGCLRYSRMASRMRLVLAA